MPRKRKRVQRQNVPLIVGGVIAAVVLLGVLIAGSLTSAASEAVSAVPTGAITAGTALECGSQECGQANAPVTIEVYADFQCPYCARADSVLQQIMPTYIDTGKVKVIYHDFAFLGAESEWAAQAAKCAADQGQFWTFGNYLFAHQAGENKGAFSRDNLKKIAAQLDLETSTFNACLDSGKYVSVVKQEQPRANGAAFRQRRLFLSTVKSTKGHSRLNN